MADLKSSFILPKNAQRVSRMNEMTYELNCSSLNANSARCVKAFLVSNISSIASVRHKRYSGEMENRAD